MTETIKILVPGKLIKVRSGTGGNTRGGWITSVIWDSQVSLENNINQPKYHQILDPKDILLVLDVERMYVYHDVFVYGVKLLWRTKIVGVFSTGVLESVEKFFEEAKQ